MSAATTQFVRHTEIQRWRRSRCRLHRLARFFKTIISTAKFSMHGKYILLICSKI